MVKKLDNIIIGNRIKEARTLRGFTQRDIAQKIGVAASTIMRYEQAQITDIKLPVIEAIAKSLSVDPSWLLGYDVPMETTAHYIDPATAAMAQEISENPELHMLFSALKDSSPEDLKLVADMVKRFKSID